MAGKKVTELPVLATAASDDVMYIVDTSTNTSKQINLESLGFITSYFNVANLNENSNGTLVEISNRVGGTITLVNVNPFEYTLTRTGGSALTGTVTAYLSQLVEDSSGALVSCLGNGITFGDSFALVNYDGAALGSGSIVKDALLTIIYVP
jgi:hypothetical protein